MRTPGFYYIGGDRKLRYNILPVHGLRVSWILLSLFWGNSFDDKVTAPEKPSFLFKLLCRIYYGYPFSKREGQTKEEKEKTITIEKKLEHLGYVQHPDFWQKGFVRCGRFFNRWDVWHDIGPDPDKTTCEEENLFETLKYFERI